MKLSVYALVLLMVSMVSSLFAQTHASTASFVLEEAPVRYVKPLVLQGPMLAPASIQHSLPYLAAKHEQVIIASLCASSSPNVAKSRWNAMAGMAGMTVNMDPLDPVSWLVISDTSWQWHHLIGSTTLPLWRGMTNLPTELMGERGNRMAIHAQGVYPVSAYQCKIMSTLTNIQQTTFWVGKDSVSGQDLRFNANFVGVHFGANGVMESTYNPSVGVWTQVGDDTVYSNSEHPTNVIYEIWLRYGASVSVTANSDIGMSMVKNQFIAINQAFTSQLIKNGEVVNEKMIMAEQPRLSIENGEMVDEMPTVNVFVEAGQDDVNYRLESKLTFDGEWEIFEDPEFYLYKNLTTMIGVALFMYPDGEFFRVRSVSP